jgi:hypothetical protein
LANFLRGGGILRSLSEWHPFQPRPRRPQLSLDRSHPLTPPASAANESSRRCKSNMSAVAPCASSSLFAGGTLAQRQWTTNAHRTREISKVVKTKEPNRQRRGRVVCHERVRQGARLTGELQRRRADGADNRRQLGRRAGVVKATHRRRVHGSDGMSKR